MLRVVVASLFIGGSLVQFVWMGFALGAVLKKLGSPAVHAWIPVQRWVAAARAGRASALTVAIARGVALLGALVAIVAGALATPANSQTDLFPMLLVVGAMVWLAGSLTGWVLWIYGAGTIQMRMRAPRGLTWVAAIWPALWSSIMGWGKYRAFGGGAAAGTPAPAEAAPAPVSAPSAPAPTSAPLPTRTPSAASSSGVQRAAPSAPAWGDAPQPTSARRSPFAALTPEALRPDTVENSDPAPAPAPSASSASMPDLASPAPAPAVEPAADPAPPEPRPASARPAPAPPAPAPDLPPPAPESAPEAPSAPPPSEVSPYVSKLSPYLATPDDAVPSQLTPYGNPPALATTAANLRPPFDDAPSAAGPPAPHADSAPAASLDSWVERMREVNAPDPEPDSATPPTVAQPEEPLAPPAPQLPPSASSTSAHPPTPAPQVAAPSAPESTLEPAAPEPEPTPPAPEPAAPALEPTPPAATAPTPTPPPATPDGEAEATGASAVLPVISPPPPSSPSAEATVAHPPVAEDDQDDDHTVVVRRPSKEWTLKVGNASYSIGDSSVVLGRATATIRPGILGIADTTKTMSKRHAELIRRGDSWWVRDLGSTNGTYLRSADGTERRIEGSDSQIVDGDLMLGDLVAQIVKAEGN